MAESNPKIGAPKCELSPVHRLACTAAAGDVQTFEYKAAHDDLLCRLLLWLLSSSGH